MTFSGDLTGISLADVFQNIAGNRTTGTLRVHWRQSERFVRFENGCVAGFSLGTGKGIAIEDHLVERGYLDDAGLKKARARSKRSRKPLGSAAVDAKALAADDLRGAYRERIEELVFDLMLLKEAAFEFIPGDPPPRVFGGEQRAMKLALEVGPLLMEGARRRDEGERISRIVTSDGDLFVLLEGWEEYELDELAAEVAPLLDGRTTVAQVRSRFFASRFAVTKAIADLVMQGAARPCTADEIEAAARDAIEAGEDAVAMELLGRALELARNDSDLRYQLAELLERNGRADDAAAEYAKLGHQAATDGDAREAIALYDRAIALAPNDLPLHERRLELVRTAEDAAAVVTETLRLVDLLQEMGLADRARTLLVETLGSRPFRADEALQQRLAEVEAALGHWEAAGRIYVRLADQVLARDEARGVALLRLAAEQCPDDDALRQRVADIQSGRDHRRRRRRRRIAIAAGVLAGLGLVTGLVWAEALSARATVAALERAVGDLRDGRAVTAIRELYAVGGRYPWTGTGRRARTLAERLINLQLAAVDEVVARGEHALAGEILQGLIEHVDRGDLRATAEARLERIEALRIADTAFVRAEGREEPERADLEVLAALRAPEYVEFVSARLLRAARPGVRRALLQALLDMKHPRGLPAVARLLAQALETETRVLCKQVFEQTVGAGRSDPEWAAVRRELAQAQLGPNAADAKAMLTLLDGSAAAPGR